jgi:hypothetical protein
MNYAFNTFSTSNALYISNAGLVGIGTSTPTQKLNVYDSGSVYGIIQTGSSAAYAIMSCKNPTNDLYVWNRGDNNTSVLSSSAWDLNIGTEAAKFVAFYTTNAERMRITSGGGVLIGKTSGSTYLNVSTAFDYLATTFTSGAGNYGYLALPQTPSTTLMLVNLTNQNNGNYNISFLMLVNTRSAAFGGGNGIATISTTQGSTGTGGEISTYAFAITGSGTSLSLRATCTLVSGSATIDFSARIIQI